MAKALDPLMATGLAGLALSIELLGLLMLAPAWHDIVKVCPAAPADVPCESCAHLAVTAAWCANILLWGDHGKRTSSRWLLLVRSNLLAPHSAELL